MSGIEASVRATASAHAAMSAATNPRSAARSAPSGDATTGVDGRLRRACHEMEAVFLRQLFEVMRESEGESGLLEESSAQDSFTALLDDHLAGEAAQKMNRGLGEALYRQISRRLASIEAPAHAGGETKIHERTTD